MLQPESDRTADGDTPLANGYRLPQSQVQIRQAADVSNQCQRSIADLRISDTDEFLVAAKIKAPLENGFDARERNASAEFLCQNACSQHGNNNIRRTGGNAIDRR